MLRASILAIRVPIGLAASVLITIGYIAILGPFSVVILPPAFVYLAVSHTPLEIRQNRLSSWPFFREYRSALAAVRDWALAGGDASLNEPLHLWTEA